ncbi:hypothetical protein SIN8267_00339 [Sinobacterium norvegicum]|uniref:Alpha/beta hydrolase n=1 Tax=Sinobacterium norvegicum TaxID=1641715 RepID=A0ABN8EHA9_9GAMM|nr:alpha/beta hydrolase [Sinobacterium norvegicum]CAH0990247.1 hypothetical protein SIN8267_00339 [Sinobacterium norvegicum]
MSTLEQALQQTGYDTVNIGYPSRDYPIEILAPLAIEPALKKCPSNSDIYFVTHSLGGILVRQYLSANTLPQLKRVVMLGPPNQGSETVDKLAGVPGFKWLNGCAGLQLGTDAASPPNTLGPANFDVGIIAGDKTINFILSGLIPGADDGKVSVSSTKLQGMNDHIQLPTTHTFMMSNKTVIKQTINYLQYGYFTPLNEQPANH